MSFSMTNFFKSALTSFMVYVVQNSSPPKRRYVPVSNLSIRFDVTLRLSLSLSSFLPISFCCLQDRLGFGSTHLFTQDQRTDYFIYSYRYLCKILKIKLGIFFNCFLTSFLSPNVFILKYLEFAYEYILQKFCFFIFDLNGFIFMIKWLLLGDKFS